MPTRDDTGADGLDGGDGAEDGPIEQPEGELPESLEEALLDAAADLEGLTVRGSGSRLEFLVGTRLVATLDGPVAEFRLDRPVAAAALRTPGTRPSHNAAERIAFEPAELDLYALDRAVAWLRSAVRHRG